MILGIYVWDQQAGKLVYSAFSAETGWLDFRLENVFRLNIFYDTTYQGSPFPQWSWYNNGESHKLLILNWLAKRRQHITHIYETCSYIPCFVIEMAIRTLLFSIAKRFLFRILVRKTVGGNGIRERGWLCMFCIVPYIICVLWFLLGIFIPILVCCSDMNVDISDGSSVWQTAWIGAQHGMFWTYK